MKKTISTILICMLLLGAMLVLVSCGGIDKGTYVSSSGITAEINGKNFVLTVDGQKTEYTYEIKNDDESDRQVIYLTDSEGETHKEYFERLDDGFEFAGQKYTKK